MLITTYEHNFEINKKNKNLVYEFLKFTLLILMLILIIFLKLEIRASSFASQLKTGNTSEKLVTPA